MSLTKEEITQLFELRKIPCNAASIDFPYSGRRIEIELQNDTGRIKFQADLNRANRIPSKITFQLRHKNIYTIRRLDFNGNHKNPPGPVPDELFEGYDDYDFKNEDHVHFFIEGYDEKWALPLNSLSQIGIVETDDIYEKMIKFFIYCNVDNLHLKIKRTLFL